MMDPNKNMLVIPLEGIVEACLDYNEGSPVLRIEGEDSRVMLMSEDMTHFFSTFEKFVMDFIALKEVTQ